MRILLSFALLLSLSLISMRAQTAAPAGTSQTSHAIADDKLFLSPKAKGNQIKHVPSATTRVVSEVKVPKVGSPRMQSLQSHPAQVSSKNDPDLVRQQRKLVPKGKSPFQGTHMREFETAPAK
jgi:hypothetical protein